MLFFGENFEVIVSLAALSAVIGITVQLVMKNKGHSRKKAELISTVVFVACLALLLFGYIFLFHQNN